MVRCYVSAGSSPRMRGTRASEVLQARALRIIPAHAGNSGHAPAHHTKRADHPRACGELPTADDHSRLENRIIPAHAGNSGPRPSSRSLFPDHPRACGELVSASPEATRFYASSGSSPRMRGTQELGLLLGHERRIIPAHAGNSDPAPVSAAILADHPRACGELRSAISTPQWMHGSSPRMRGTRESCRYPATWWRIIPAHAGNSFAPLVVVIEQPDHPRACGELERRRIFDGEDVGSSPRMRGTRRRWLEVDDA